MFKKIIVAFLSFSILIMFSWSATMTTAIESALTFEEAFPDENFRNFVFENIIDDGRLASDVISVEDKAIMATTTSLFVAERQISDLTGVAFFIGLEYLDVSMNQLTELDISNNIALTALYASNNQLTELDVSNNPALDLLLVNSNRLRSLSLLGSGFNTNSILYVHNNYMYPDPDVSVPEWREFWGWMGEPGNIDEYQNLLPNQPRPPRHRFYFFPQNTYQPILEQVATPTASPNGGTFTGSVSVTLSSATDGAVIYYTLDGTTPTSEGQFMRVFCPTGRIETIFVPENPSQRLYAQQITLTETTTVKAIAVKDGMENSEVLTVTFTRQINQSNQGNNNPRPPIIITPPLNNNNDTVESTLPIEIELVPTHAEPTAVPVLLNGENVAFQAYHISGHNFFRLRDVAYALSGTSAQFNVVWDDENNMILLTTGESYEVVGGEMVNNSSGAVIAQPTNSTIILNGIAVEFTAFHINGNNYFMLRDLGEVLGFDVDWYEEMQTILISTD